MRGKENWSTFYPHRWMCVPDALAGIMLVTQLSCQLVQTKLKRPLHFIFFQAVRVFVFDRLQICPNHAPIGLVNPKCIGLIGSGVVVHVPSFFAELDALQAQGNRLLRSFRDIFNIKYRLGLHRPIVHLRSRAPCFRLASDRGWA